MGNNHAEAHSTLDLVTLRVDSLVITRGRRNLFEDISLEFRPGVTVILGPNGAGKTTLLDSLSAPQSLREGSVYLDQRLVPSDLPVADYFASTGYMPQKWEYFPGFTTLDTVEYAAWLKRVPKKDIRARSLLMLETLGLKSFADKKVSRLSGGMQQRVGLAEAFVHDPSVVFLDEPTVGLDPVHRDTFRSFVRAEARRRTIILSTHLTDDVAAVSDRVMILKDGQVLFDGTPDSLAALDTEHDSHSTPIEAGYLRVVTGN